jgi:hypothetical protein
MTFPAENDIIIRNIGIQGLNLQIKTDNMVLKDILAISGEPGLFKFIAQGKNSIIVEHLETKKRISAYGSAKVSSLEDIAIFTEKEDVPLGKVFDILHEKSEGGPCLDAKSAPDNIKKWFSEILPDYSRDKVYVSDMKKIAAWYNILQKLDLLVKEEPEKEEAEKETPASSDVPAASDEVAATEPAPEKKKKTVRKPKAE